MCVCVYVWVRMCGCVGSAGASPPVTYVLSLVYRRHSLAVLLLESPMEYLLVLKSPMGYFLETLELLETLEPLESLELLNSPME